jgi:hypothetical protein
MSSWLSFLASRGARLTATTVADFGEPTAEIVAARDATILVDLSHNALLAVTGDEATEFLHAQFTSDVQVLQPAPGSEGKIADAGDQFVRFGFARKSVRVARHWGHRPARPVKCSLSDLSLASG